MISDRLIDRYIYRLKVWLFDVFLEENQINFSIFDQVKPGDKTWGLTRWGLIQGGLLPLPWLDKYLKVNLK